MKNKLLVILTIVFIITGCTNRRAPDNIEIPLNNDISIGDIRKIEDFSNDVELGIYDNYKYAMGIIEINDDNVKDDEVLVDVYTTECSYEIEKINLYLDSMEDKNLVLSLKDNEENIVLTKDGKYYILFDLKDSADIGYDYDTPLEYGKHYALVYASPQEILEKYGQ